MPSVVLPIAPVIAWGMQGLFRRGFKVNPRFMHQRVRAGQHCRMLNQAGPFPAILTDDELRQIKLPILLLLGEQETTFDPEAARDRAKRLIPNLQGEVMRDAGHALTMEQPEQVDAKILQFLA